MMMNNLLVVVFHKTFDQIKWGPYFFYISNEHFEQIIQYMTTVMYKSKHSRELDGRWEVNTVGEASKIYVKSVFLSQGLNNNVMSVSCHKLLDTPSLYGAAPEIARCSLFIMLWFPTLKAHVYYYRSCIFLFTMAIYIPLFIIKLCSSKAYVYVIYISFCKYARLFLWCRNEIIRHETNITYSRLWMLSWW